ncbi:MAG: aldo/keto reductase, partial [Actinobacteria bacterium]|nr:aldo/keto reductase [Actinomycetota bacterium]
HRVFPISAIQSEWSLFTRELEADVIPMARRLGIGVVPYSPLGRGVLSGTVRSDADLEEGDFRRFTPRFHGESLAANVNLVDQLADIASDLSVSTAQLALAWVHARGSDVVPIPGTKRRKWLEANLASLALELSAEICTQLEAIVEPSAVVGDRYPAGFMDTVNR